jgi:hypothetical protein
MATHALGSGTCNISLNVRASEGSLLALTAIRKKFKSVNAYTKYLILLGMEKDDPAAAEKLRQIRNIITGAALFLVLSVGVARAWYGRDADEFRANRIVRVLRGGRCREEAV